MTTPNPQPLTAEDFQQISERWTTLLQEYGDYRVAQALATSPQSPWRPIDCNDLMQWLVDAGFCHKKGDASEAMRGVIQLAGAINKRSITPPTTMKENNHDHP